MTDCDGGVQKEKGPGGVRVKKCTSPQGVELGIRRENRWRKEKTPHANTACGHPAQFYEKREIQEKSPPFANGAKDGAPAE